MEARRFSGSDVVAGVSVALILIPQSLAYAAIAGVPAHVGLFAAALPTIAAALFASSPYLQTGPTAVTALLTFGALSAIATPLTAGYVALAGLLAILVGLIRVAVGLTRLGVIAFFMSRPVIIGFTTGATLLIAASQLPNLLGLEQGGSRLLVGAARALASPAEWHLASLVYGLAAIGVMEVSRRIGPRVPGVLIAVVAAILASNLFGFEGAVVGEIPSRLPPLTLNLPWGSWLTLLIPAGVIALVGFTEAAAISSLFAAEDRARWNPNREFLSQGMANLASGISGGFPVGASFGRSSVNRLTGAKTRWSGAVTGVAVLAFLPASAVLEPLPTSVLAAIVIVAVSRLIRPQAIIPIWRQSRFQALVAGLTLVATLVLSPRIDLAVLFGIGMAVAVHLGRESRLAVTVSSEGTVLRLAPKGVVFFGSTPALVDALINSLAEHPDAEALVIDLSGVGRLDFTGGDALTTVVNDSLAAGLEVRFDNIPPHARRIVGGVVNRTGATA